MGVSGEVTSEAQQGDLGTCSVMIRLLSPLLTETDADKKASQQWGKCVGGESEAGTPLARLAERVKR